MAFRLFSQEKHLYHWIMAREPIYSSITKSRNKTSYTAFKASFGFFGIYLSTALLMASNTLFTVPKPSTIKRSFSLSIKYQFACLITLPPSALQLEIHENPSFRACRSSCFCRFFTSASAFLRARSTFACSASSFFLSHSACTTSLFAAISSKATM
jgi:hypothetical protein